MTSDTHATSPSAAQSERPRSYEIPTLTDQLAGLRFSSAVRSAYWLGVSREHARTLDDEVRRAPTDKIRAEYIALRDEMVARAAGNLSDLKDALGSDNQAPVPGPPASSFRRIVAEFDCALHARDYAKAHGYTVTAGVNRLFAVILA